MKQILIIISILLITGSACAHGPVFGDRVPGEITAEELLYLDGVTSAIQTQIDGKQTLDAELTAIAGLTSASGKFIQFTGSETAGMVDDSNMRFTENQTMQAFGASDATPDVTNGGTVVVRLWQTGATGAVTITDFDDGDDHSEFAVGDYFVLRVDDANTKINFNANANIEGNGGVDFTGSATQIVYLVFLYDDSRWNEITLGMMSDPTTQAFRGIEVPTLVASELDDTSDPHTLIEIELKGTILSNSESSGPDEWDLPVMGEGWNFIFIIEAVQNVIIDPNGSEQLYLNGTQMAAGEPIVNEAPTVGEMIACFSTETAIYCKSDDSDWAEDTPP